MPQQTLAEALSIYQSQFGERTNYVVDWQTQIPTWSRWRPGCIGKPDCQACKGIGYVRADLPVGHPMFGKMFLCECAVDGEKYREAQRLSSASDLLPEDYGLRWNMIMPTPKNQDAIKIIKFVLERGYGWVYIHGPSGPGKSLILKTAIAESLAIGQGAVYSNWYDILDDMRAGVGSGNFSDRLDKWRMIPILAVDEMSREQGTEWVAETKPKLLDRRHELATISKKGVTLFASNSSPDELPDWLRSRIRDGRYHVIFLDDADMRLAQTWGDE